ncbi:MAG: hypothetical protein KAU20_04595 [Nanoarchaeota archaeon]|nr:hypothetical protein [Nanoarchaeota archaeon]
MAKEETKNKGPIIDLGEFHTSVYTDIELKRLHKLIDKEKDFLIKDFKKVGNIKEEEDIEKKAIKNFEKKLQSLIETTVYLEGYINEIKSGNEMLKINTSVKHLGNKLIKNINEVEKLSSSMMKEEEKMLKFAKHIKNILKKAKNYQKQVFG